MNEAKINALSKAPFRAVKRQKAGGVDDFGKLIDQAVKKVDTLEKEADHSIVELLQGNAGVHETMIALQKADISMRMLLTVRNKVIEAYREIMRMQF